MRVTAHISSKIIEFKMLLEVSYIFLSPQSATSFGPAQRTSCREDSDNCSPALPPRRKRPQLGSVWKNHRTGQFIRRLAVNGSSARVFERSVPSIGLRKECIS